MINSAWKIRSRYLLVALIVFLLDQLTKRIVSNAMVPYQSIEIVPDLLNLTYIHNRGAVFGLGSNFSSPYLSWFLSLLSLISLGVILVYFLRVGSSNPRLYVGLSLVLGGAMGNLLDRISSGFVVDFIDVHWFHHHWPYFNVADLSICVGVGLLLISMSAKAEKAALAATTKATETTEI
ncbi:MAG TPA: signal peptidase II [Acidobacteriota bacterium]|nr:signal peptidase II [Acidobacteriota bacterium]